MHVNKQRSILVKSLLQHFDFTQLNCRKHGEATIAHPQHQQGYGPDLWFHWLDEDYQSR